MAQLQIVECLNDFLIIRTKSYIYNVYVPLLTVVYHHPFGFGPSLWIAACRVPKSLFVAGCHGLWEILLQGILGTKNSGGHVAVATISMNWDLPKWWLSDQRICTKKRRKSVDDQPTILGSLSVLVGSCTTTAGSDHKIRCSCSTPNWRDSIHFQQKSAYVICISPEKSCTYQTYPINCTWYTSTKYPIQ